MERIVISTCKKTRRAKWSGINMDDESKKRNTDAGMQMVVYHQMVNGKKTSKTVFEMPR